ncbi:MAG: hypothetical protein KF819_28105 [Labilithrix sp.]|nr:hypothetical protein [Labilithrix sp.]
MSLLVALASCGDGESSADRSLSLRSEPAVTDVGTPTGQAVTRTIGPSGGTLSSADGKLEIVVPPGALTVDTELSITPISATAPGALAAWRLGPEGTTFGAPVSLRFSASDADLAGSESEALRLGTQRADRTWAILTAAERDGKTLTVRTTHFSDWSALLGWQLRPGSAKVKTGQSVKLDVRYCHLVEDESEELAGIAAECQEQDLQPILGAWAVNGVAGGDASSGTITNADASATYTAPSSTPSSNPVAVSVEFDPTSRRKTLLVSNIDVVGASGYSGTFSFSTKAANYEIEATEGFVEWTVDHESSDRREYAPSGTVRLKFTSSSPACDPVEGTYPIEEGDLVVHAASAPMFASQYTFNVRLTPSVTLSCRGYDGQPFTTSFQIPAYLQVGLCDGATLPGYVDERQLTGSGACPVVGVVASSWSFTMP